MSDEARRDPRPDITVDHRPWGSFELFCHNEAATVKILTVAPRARLSLQRHRLRDEMWTVLDSALLVEVDGREHLAEAGEKVWVPRGALHRVTNKGDAPARLLEIAYGVFDECDIERVSDDYAREVTDGDGAPWGRPAGPPG